MSITKKILIVQTAFLGDVILTTPLIKAVKQVFPKSWVAVLAIPSAKPLLEGNPFIDQILIYDKKGKGRGIRNFFKIVEKIRNCNFDLCLSPHRSFRTALMLFLSKIPLRIGFQDSTGSFFYHQTINRNLKIHDIERNLSLLEPFETNVETFDKNLLIAYDKKDTDFAQKILSENNITSEDILIGISPGSVWATKRWAADGFAKLIDLLIRNLKAKVILFGGINDHKVVTEIVHSCQEYPLNLCGKTTIKQLTALIGKCRLFITNDSGPMHIAISQKVPVVAIFGPTTPEMGFAPYSNDAIIVQKDLSCRPCSLHGGRRCPKKHFNCMKLITAEEVFEAVKNKRIN